MSERTVTFRMSGPQYRTLLAALAMAQNEWEQDGTGPTRQAPAVLERVGDKIVAAWNRHSQAVVPPRVGPKGPAGDSGASRR